MNEADKKTVNERYIELYRDLLAVEEKHEKWILDESPDSEVFEALRDKISAVHGARLACMDLIK